MALAQVKVDHTSENLLNLPITQIIYSFYRAKEITEKLHNNIMNSINMDAIKQNGYYTYEF